MIAPGAAFSVRLLFVILICSGYTPAPTWMVSPGHATSTVRCSERQGDPDVRQKFSPDPIVSDPEGDT